eukprot:CAMPEP_0181413784 /NCGR_PEP_ID=MMETSP1110-20121109/9157_1 /TAXON_ID=174948 /ORGANISM="Symbiodinium sp., Strain CCMP421" /LENGTH=196 /DNA_ID=CAMNT_0023536621 /DNA_START=141 /DNA_END=731 /DNA_ORIENTATION=-
MKLPCAGTNSFKVARPQLERAAPARGHVSMRRASREAPLLMLGYQAERSHEKSATVAELGSLEALVFVRCSRPTVAPDTQEAPAILACRQVVAVLQANVIRQGDRTSDALLAGPDPAAAVVSLTVLDAYTLHVVDALGLAHVQRRAAVRLLVVGGPDVCRRGSHAAHVFAMASLSRLEGHEGHRPGRRGVLAGSQG